MTQVTEDQSMQKTQAESQKEDLVTVNKALSQVKKAVNKQISEVRLQIQTQLGNINSFFNKQCNEMETNTSNSEDVGVASKGFGETNTEKEYTSENIETLSVSLLSTSNNEQGETIAEENGEQQQQQKIQQL